MRGLILFLVIINLLATMFLGYLVWDKGLLDEDPPHLTTSPPPASPVASPQSPPNTPPNIPPVYLDITRSGTDVMLNIGQELNVTLETDGVLDHVWALEENAAIILEFISSSGNMTGQNWVFKAINKGKRELKMVYGRIVEGNIEAPQKLFSLNVTVE